MKFVKRAVRFLFSVETYTSLQAIWVLVYDGFILLTTIYVRRLLDVFVNTDNNKKDVEFSIIMPCFNRKECIDSAIVSVLKQTNQSYELIIVDDGSKDGSSDHIQNNYASEIECGKIKLILLPENKGVCYARNKGLGEAQGSIICYLDSDNKWCRWYLDYIANAYRKDGKIKMIYTAMLSINLNIHTIDVVGRSYDEELMMEQNYIDMNVFSHRKSLYQLYGGFDVELKRLVDYELIMRYAHHVTPIYLNRIGAIYLYRQGIDTITSSKMQSYDAAFKLAKKKIISYRESC
ncbi:glycosyltransferase [Alteromonas gracilis]|uniref:glycosyltransferase n=1 Tax=Alteromonas gracilis TaxID=1479524 RepID=UPI002FE14BDE